MQTESKTGPVALACAFGTLVGLIVARNLVEDMGFFSGAIGALVGAFCGYLFIDFEDVVKTTRQVYREIVMTWWPPDYAWWRRFSELIQAELNRGLNVSILMLTFLSVVCGLTGYLRPDISFAGAFRAVFPVTVVFVGFLWLVVAIADVGDFFEWHHVRGIYGPFSYNPWQCWTVRFPRAARRWLKEKAEQAQHGAMEVLKFAVLLLLVFIAFVLGIPKVLRMVYSELRLLCAFNVGAAVTIAWLYSLNIWFGMGLGALLGVISYEIITIRVLKVPGQVSILAR